MAAGSGHLHRARSGSSIQRGDQGDLRVIREGVGRAADGGSAMSTVAFEEGGIMRAACCEGQHYRLNTTGSQARNLRPSRSYIEYPDTVLNGQ